MFKYIFLIFLVTYADTLSFRITVINIQDRVSPVYLLVFDSPRGFPSQVENSVYSWKGSPAEAEEGIPTGLPEGVYAVSVFQDSDRNGELTKRFYGAPREPFGVSGALSKPMRSPRFKSYCLEVKADGHLMIHLWSP